MIVPNRSTGASRKTFCDIEELAAKRLQETVDNLRDTLGLALALDGSPKRQARLGRLFEHPTGFPFEIALTPGYGLKLSQKGSVAPLRFDLTARPGPMRYDLFRRTDLHPNVAALVRESGAGERAQNLLSPLLSGNLISRQDWSLLARWSPILEQTAYAGASRLWEVRDAAGPKLGAFPNPSARRAMHAVVISSAQLVLLSTSSEARAWLTPMAASFEWVNWTPSFPLVRERSLWLGACGAHAARGFGVGVVDRYLDALVRADAALKTLDALIGLVSIASGEIAERENIRVEIARRRDEAMAKAKTNEKLYVALSFDAAGEALSGEEPWGPTLERLLGWEVQPERLPTAKTFSLDVGLTHDSFKVLGIAAAPALVRMPRSALLPVSRLNAKVRSDLHQALGEVQWEHLAPADGSVDWKH